MIEKAHGTGGLGFLDPLARLFRRKEEPAAVAAAPEESHSFAKLDADFERAVQRLNEKVEEQRRALGGAPSSRAGMSAEDRAAERAAERARRIVECHQAMREDIAKMHAELGTALSEADLEALPDFLEELETVAGPENRSHSLLPRARHAIGEKLRAEAGELAVERLVASLQREQRSWPDPTIYRATATPEEIERSRRRRLGETRAAFLGDGFQKIAERMVGHVRGWGADYPDRGSPLWEECVLEGVAAGIRAQVLRDFVEILRRNREDLLARIEEAIGAEVEALQGAMQDGIRSLDQASQAVASALSVVDKVAPEIAWQLVRSERPDARGEAAD